MSRRSRRIPIILALLVWLSGTTIAAGHSCVTPTEVVVGQPATITLGVASEGPAPVVAVDVTLPAGLVVDELVATKGWTVEREGDTLHYRGGSIANGACGFLLLRATPTRKGTLVVPITTQQADGSTRRLDRANAFDPLAGQILTVVTDPAAPRHERGVGAVVQWVGLGLVVASVAYVLKHPRRARRRSGRKPSEGR